MRNSKLVVLDEATANIDVVSEQTIQKLISEELKYATVLIIAHRLNTVTSSDKILVLDEGQKKEFGSPADLMKN